MAEEKKVSMTLVPSGDYDAMLKIMVRIWVSTNPKRGKYSSSAYVRWRLIDELRDVLEMHGYDTAKMRAVHDRVKREQEKMVREQKEAV